MNFGQVKYEPGKGCESNSQDTSKKEFLELDEEIVFLDFKKTDQLK